MRIPLLLAAASLVLVCAVACSRPSSPAFRTTATVEDIMDAIVDPHADGVWDAVETEATLAGVVRRVP